jgi:quercetin dioxygenase-like cupin family protein
MEVQPSTPTVKGPAGWFTGDVWIDALAQGHGASPMSAALVHFAPGARTAWHRHTTSQTLRITEGEARVQSRGAPIATLRPGDLAYTPGGEWHWHGTAPSHFMTHLSIIKGDTEWGEHVTDAEYRAEPK